jgi:outer membrane protein W
MHAIWFEDISYDWASYAQNIEGIGTVGIGVQYLSYGSITETDVSGLDVGNFSPNDLAAALSWGHMVRKVSVGVNVKYITSHIKNTANAVALDLGTQYALNGNLTLGAAIQNLGSKMKFVSEEDSLPLVTRMGAAYALSDDWTAAFDISAPIDYEPSFALGTEYRYQISGQMSAAGRVGYNSKGKETGGLNGVGMGIGLTCLNYGIDYALVTFGELGNGHRISFSFHF